MAATIQAIDKESVHKICSGQVVLDLATAVKELVENSIDAGANSIDINFKENGIEGIEVVDNGSGIDPSNYESLALKHYTSKLSSFEDLESVLTFGFRGEALSSLCALSNLTVITATKEQAPMGVKLEYDRNGNLVSKQPVSRTNGTTILLTNIFHSLPVRLQEFKRNIKREFSKALTILQAYSIISQNIRISVNNQSGKRPSTKIMATSKNREITANISNVFGVKLVSQIMSFKVDLASVIGEGVIEGYISKPEWGLGRSTSDRQYFYVNGRPCMLPKIARTLNEIYRFYISNQYPVVIANLKIPTDAYDVNVSPDKRTIFIHNENRIAEMIMEQLKEQWEPSRSTFQVHPLISNKPSEHTITPTMAPPQQATFELKTTNLLTSIQKPTKSIPTLNSFAMSNGNQYKVSPSKGKRTLPSTSSNTLLNFVSKKPKTEKDKDEVMEEASSISEKSSITLVEEPTRDVKVKNVAEEDGLEYMESTQDIASYKGLCNTVGRTMTIKPIDFEHMTKQEQEGSTTLSPLSKQEKTTLTNASVKNTEDNEKATKALSRVINKLDFARMEVLGQFNLGFMIASLDDKDIYIIDQHASDEKYNFETLQQTTQIKGQKLLSSPLLELTAAEEHIVMDNLEIFKANGFDVEVLPDNEPTKRIRVLSQPVSKNTMFDKKDFSEIIHLIGERPGEMVRCSRNRAMFASRACHKAARIGDSLSKRQMTQIVRHMGEIDQPWNCPHGRPTMRHLLNLSEIKQSSFYHHRKKKLTFSGSCTFKK